MKSALGSTTSILLLLLVGIINPIFAQGEVQIEPKQDTEIDNPGIEDVGDKPEFPKKQHLFILSPGLGIEFMNVNIDGPQGSFSEFRYPNNFRGSWFLHGRTRDYQLGEYYGVYLALYNDSFYFNHQNAADALYLNGSGAVKNVSTEIRGQLTYLVPTFFLGPEDPKRFRIGFGVGLGRVKIKGVYELDNPNTSFIAFDTLKNPRGHLTALKYHYWLGNFDYKTDPALTYYVATLDEPGTLMNLAQYLIARGWFRPDDSDMFLALVAAQNGNPGKYNAIEALTLFSLTRKSINLKGTIAPFIGVFYEFPSIGQFRIRYTGVGSLGTTHNKASIGINRVYIQCYYPLEFL